MASTDLRERVVSTLPAVATVWRFGRFGGTSKQHQSNIKAASKQHQSSIKAASKQHQSNMKAASKELVETWSTTHQPGFSGAARTSGTALVRSSVLAEVYSALGDSVQQLFGGVDPSSKMLADRYRETPELAAYLTARALGPKFFWNPKSIEFRSWQSNINFWLWIQALR